MNIGWYVHHSGRGHLTRFLAIRPHLDAEVWVFSSLPEPAVVPPRTRWVVLPSDADPIVDADGTVREAATANPTANSMLHWAPTAHEGHARRLAMIAHHSVSAALERFVVDVSVEVALFVRLLGLTTIVMGQPGARVDAPHQLAYKIADLILCPWAESTYDVDPFGSALERVRWVGGVSRFGDRDRDLLRDSDLPRDRADVGRAPGLSVVLLGAMATPRPADVELRALDAECPDVAFTSVGFVPGSSIDDPWPRLVEADVVIAAAGQNSVADIAAARARAIIVPQPRPFDEQAATGALLRENGLAEVVESWPKARAMRLLIERAMQRRPDWSVWATSGAAGRAAAAILEGAR